MKTKLTLSVQEDIVRKARRISRKERKSVSLLFEEFILRQEQIKPYAVSGSSVEKITGILKGQGLTDREMKDEYRKAQRKKHA